MDAARIAPLDVTFMGGMQARLTRGQRLMLAGDPKTLVIPGPA